MARGAILRAMVEADVPPSCVARVQDALACVAEPGEPRRARRDGACVVVERGGRRAFPYLRFHRLAEDAWLLEELGGPGPTLHWVQRRRAKSLDDLLRRWLDAGMLQSDIRVTAPDGGAALAAFPLRLPTSGRRQRRETVSHGAVEAGAARRAAWLERVLGRHRSWLVGELSRSRASGPTGEAPANPARVAVGSLRRPLVERQGVDAAGDDATERVPAVTAASSGLARWARASPGARRGGSTRPWSASSVGRRGRGDSRRRPPCPVYLSVHDGLDRGAQPGHRTRGRRSAAIDAQAAGPAS